jgi:hypothetical protein
VPGEDRLDRVDPDVDPAAPHDTASAVEGSEHH